MDCAFNYFPNMNKIRGKIHQGMEVSLAVEIQDFRSILAIWWKNFPSLLSTQENPLLDCRNENLQDFNFVPLVQWRIPLPPPVDGGEGKSFVGQEISARGWRQKFQLHTELKFPSGRQFFQPAHRDERERQQLATSLPASPMTFWGNLQRKLQMVSTWLWGVWQLVVSAKSWPNTQIANT